MILQVTRNVMTAILSLPPGDIYNLSVTACTERGSNTSTLHLVKLGKMSAWQLGAGGRSGNTHPGGTTVCISQFSMVFSTQ